MGDSIDMAMDSIRSELADIKAKISQCRKKGFDTKIAVIAVETSATSLAFSFAQELERIFRKTSVRCQAHC